MRAAIEDPEVDAVIAIFTSLEIIDSMAVADGIIRGAAGHGKPVMVCFMGKVSTKPAIAHMKAAGLPVYTFPEEAAHAMWALARYRQWLERPDGRIVEFADIDHAAIRGVFAGVRAGQRELLTLAEAQRVIEACGVRVAPWREASSDLDAVEAADTVGYPVALKVSSSVITHKSEMGGVRLGLAHADAVARAAVEVLAQARTADPAATLVIQRMAPKGTEVIIGATRDPKFGPLIMFGLGGIFVEVLKDVAFRLQPMSDVDAGEMLDEIKGAPLLDGARGHAPADRATLREVLLRVNALLTMYPEIEEIDMNPFMAGPTGDTSMAVDARLRVRG